MANSVRFKASLDDQVSGRLGKIRDNFDRLGKTQGFKSLVQGVGVGVGISAWNAVGSAVRSAADFMGDSIGVASDLAESMSKANVVFGDSSAAVDRFAAASAESFGISKRAAYEATGSFGNLFTTMGLGREAAASMSVDITRLAADLASFHNIAIDDALTKLRAGLVGEVEPMRTLGVAINATAVENKALAMGLATSRKEITESAKVQARYALIVEQTGNAQGDFARTSDGLANSQRVLQAMMEDVQAEIGEELLPAMLQLARVAKDDVVPAISDMIDTYSHLQWAMEQQRRNAEDYAFWQRGLLGLWTDSRLSADAYAESLEATARASEAGAEGYAELAQSLGITGDSMGELNAAMRESRGASGAVTDSLAKVDDSLADTAKEMADLEKRSDDLWDSLIEGTRAMTQDEKLELQKLPLQIRSAQADVVAAQKELDSARGSAARREAEIRLIEAKQDLNRLQDELRALKSKYARTGEILGYALGSNLHAEVVRWNTLTRREIARLGEVRLTNPGTNSSGPERRAAGGPVSAREVYWVGEDGPELFVPKASGTIVPTESLVPTMGTAAVGAAPAPVNVAVYLDSDQIAARVERRQYFAASVAPVSAR